VFCGLSAEPQYDDLFREKPLDVSIEFSVYKNAYINCCQMSFSRLRIHENQCWLGFFKGALSWREANGGMGGKEGL